MSANILANALQRVSKNLFTTGETDKARQKTTAEWYCCEI